MTETPAWFISGPSLDSVGEKREKEKRAENIATLKGIFPDATTETLDKAISAGGDLTTIVDRLLAAQYAEDSSGSAVASTSSAFQAPPAFGGGGAGPSNSEPGRSCLSSGGGPSGPKRRVSFKIEQMESADGPAGGEMSRLSDEELCEQMASSGISSAPTVGSARGAARGSGSSSSSTEGAGSSSSASSSSLPATSSSNTLQQLINAGGGSLDGLRTQPLLQLASGPLKLTGRVVRTINELETGYLVAEKIVTKFVIECQQLGFKWEVARRYSEFHKFNELLTLQWEDLP